MFAPTTPLVPYMDPWLQSLPERLAMLAAGKQRVAYYYEAPNNSTFRYRAYNMAQVLNADESRRTSACWFFRYDLHRMDELAELASMLVICRSGYDHRVAQLIARFHALGKPVLFDIDDFVFDTDYTHLVIDALALDQDDPRVWDDWFGMMARMGQTLKCCDGAITTNAFLAERIRNFSGKSVAVIPNFMNREQLAMSARVFEAKQARRFQGDGSIWVGYFSGSPSHKRDFEIVEPAVAALMQQDPRVRLMLVGYIQPGSPLAAFGDRIAQQPFQDYVNLQRLVSTVEFNLMPLQCNVFADCKSELKYFEAAAVGTLSIASPSHNYAACIEDGANGYLSKAHRWLPNLERAVAAMGDYEVMALMAMEHALRRYAWEGQVDAISSALAWVPIRPKSAAMPAFKSHLQDAATSFDADLVEVVRDSRADQLLRGIDVAKQAGGEIGPLDRPLVPKSAGTIYYVDHCDTTALKSRWAADAGVDVSALHVDAVWGSDTLREALGRAGAFEGRDGLDYIVASHVIEHVPDLVSWLREVADVLTASGRLRLAIPDMRYTFDIKRRPSALSEVLDAFVRKRRAPSASRVLDFTLNMVEVDVGAAWQDALPLHNLKRGFTDQQALELAADAEQNGTYHDVHCWVFTPESFVELMILLARCQLLELACEWVSATKPDTFEFFVGLRPEADQLKVLASWQQHVATGPGGTEQPLLPSSGSDSNKTR